MAMEAAIFHSRPRSRKWHLCCVLFLTGASEAASWRKRGLRAAVSPPALSLDGDRKGPANAVQPVYFLGVWFCQHLYLYIYNGR